MSKKTHDAISRSDRVLVAAMAIILATASAAIGASMTYRPSTDKTAAPVVQVAAIEAPKPIDAVRSRLLAEHKCLSEVLYYEARGEGAGGQKAVAEVIFHRINHGNYGHSICAVVYEGSKRPGCQFSFTCNGDMKRPKQKSWRPDFSPAKSACATPPAAPPISTRSRFLRFGPTRWKKPPRSATTFSIVVRRGPGLPRPEV